jgi:hypothetical protein
VFHRLIALTSPQPDIPSGERCHVQSRENYNYDNQTNDDTKCVRAQAVPLIFSEKKRI